jgi:hypothetical protein
MRFRVGVNTLDGKLSYERDNSADALDVAEGGKESLGVHHRHGPGVGFSIGIGRGYF